MANHVIIVPPTDAEAVSSAIAISGYSVDVPLDGIKGRFAHVSRLLFSCTRLLVVLVVMTVFARPAFAQTPAIVGVTSQSAGVGARVTLLGTNLGLGSRTVSVGGVSAQVLPMLNSMQANAIDFIVPAGASAGVTTISAMVNGVSAGTLLFTVLAGAPTVTAYPSALSAGDIVTIGGNNLALTTNGGPNYVLIGNSVVPATASSSGWTFQVPASVQPSSTFFAVVDGMFSNGFAPLITTPTRTSIVLNPVSVQQGQLFTLTANVTSVGGGNNIVGSATCTANGATLGSAIPIQGGTSGSISVSTSGLSLGTDSIICTYLGSGDFAASTSPAATLTVTSATTPGGSLYVVSVSPSTGYAGLAVNVSGSGFGSPQGTSVITFNGKTAVVLNWSDSMITAIVPSTATTGPVVVTLATPPSSNNNVILTVDSSLCTF